MTLLFICVRVCVCRRHTKEGEEIGEGVGDKTKTEGNLSTTLGLVNDLQCKLFSCGPEEKQRN